MPEKIQDFLKVVQTFANDFDSKIKKTKPVNEIQDIYHIIFRSLQRDASTIVQSDLDGPYTNFIDELIEKMTTPFNKMSEANFVKDKYGNILGVKLTDNNMITYQEGKLHTIEYFDSQGTNADWRDFIYFPPEFIL